MRRDTKVKPVPHLSFQTGGREVLDEVDASLLRGVSETNSLAKAARVLGVSYRNAWGRIRRIESRSGMHVLETKAGGAAGGGSRLTEKGAAMLKEFTSVRKYLFSVLDDRESAGNLRYRLSARNVVAARITGIDRGDITSLVRMSSAGPVKLTSIISNEAVDDLQLGAGDEVEAVIKSTEVMVAKPYPPPQERKGRARRSNA